MQFSIISLVIFSLLDPALSRVVRRAANLQSFTGALGGITPTPVLNSGDSTRPFEVKGDTFVNFAAAQQRSCDQQFNACADAANKGAAFSVSQCQTQQTACTADSTEASGAVLSSSTSPSAASSSSASSCSGSQAAAAAPAKQASTATTGSTSNLDLGTCSNPTILFGLGFDGRNEDSFEPANKADFNHGSALNIAVISSFICGQLQSACKASTAANSACSSASSAAAQATGQAAADAFNKFFT